MKFELYIEEKNLTGEIWRKCIYKILKFTHTWEKTTFEIHFDNGLICFYVHSPINLALISAELHPFILKSTTSQTFLPATKKSLGTINFHNQNFFSLKENLEIKKHISLQKILFTITKLPAKLSLTKTSFYYKKSNQNLYFSSQRSIHFPEQFLAIDFSKIVQYKKKSLPPYTKIEKILPLLTNDPSNGLLEVLGFPYINQNKYLSLPKFGFNKHSLIVGQTGTGKSKYIELLINEIYKHHLEQEYTIIVLDPHAVMSADFLPFAGNISIDFLQTSCQLFAQIGEPKIATELTILLFKTLMGEQFNAKTERLLKYSLFVLFSAGKMSLETLRGFLSDLFVRKEILRSVDMNANIAQFFDTDFIEMETKFYEFAIMPVLTLIDELAFLPISNFNNSPTLQELVNNHSLIFLSLNKILLGDKATKLIAGLLIQQIFLLTQTKLLKKKILFVIDEVSVVANDSLSAILSEARKFNLSLFLTQQYLTQVNPEILTSILTNVSNYFVFKVAEEDARLLAQNLEFDFPSEQLKTNKEQGLSELDMKIKMITTLNPRECVVRLYGDGKFYPVFKARTLDI